MNHQWKDGPPCGACGKTTLLISEGQVTELLGLARVPQEERQKAAKAAYRCTECAQVSCTQCAFTTGKSLGLTVIACPKCHSTKMVTIAQRESGLHVATAQDRMAATAQDRVAKPKKKWWQFWK